MLCKIMIQLDWNEAQQSAFKKIFFLIVLMWKQCWEQGLGKTKYYLFFFYNIFKTETPRYFPSYKNSILNLAKVRREGPDVKIPSFHVCA